MEVEMDKRLLRKEVGWMALFAGALGGAGIGLNIAAFLWIFASGGGFDIYSSGSPPAWQILAYFVLAGCGCAGAGAVIALVLNLILFEVLMTLGSLVRWLFGKILQLVRIRGCQPGEFRAFREDVENEIATHTTPGSSR
jgi:hypothetical protein